MNENKYPRALAFLKAMPQPAIIDWLTNSEIGRTALQALERKLTTLREPTGPDAGGTKQ
jgi:hypothetical protein